MKRAEPRGLAAALAALLLGGCALAPRDPVEVHEEVLAALPAELPRARPRRVELLVGPVRAAPGYDGTGIAYAVRPYEVGTFALHEWVAPPARMFEPLLVRTLEGTGAFAAVLGTPGAGHPRYVLRVEQLRLLQDFTGASPVLEMSLRAQLLRAGDGAVVATREFACREPMAEREPHAGVVAANRATATLLSELAGFVVGAAR